MADDITDDAIEEPEDGDTFTRAYVDRLRRQMAGYRDRAKTAETRVEELTAAEERSDALAHRLHTELVERTGKLAAPDLLPFDAEHLEDSAKLDAAIDALIEQRPYAKARTVTGDIGQGARSTVTEAPTFSSLLRQQN